MLSRLAAGFFFGAALACSGPRVKNQTSGERALATPNLAAPKLVPISPLVFDYTVWDHHFMQWLSDASPYEMVELLAKDSPTGPRLWVLLTERTPVQGSKRQVHLVNSADVARSLQLGAGDRQVHVVDLHYERHEDSSGSRLHLSGDTPLGALDWDFTTQGLPAPEHGHRLIDATEAQHDLRGGLLVFYLEASALAAEDTRLSLGQATEPVAVWSELSRPPHFKAYRGVYSRPAHVGYFPSLPPTTIESTRLHDATAIEPRWSCTWRTVGHAAEPLTVKGMRRDSGWVFQSERFSQETRAVNHENLTERLTATDGAHAMTLAFNPPVADLSSLRDRRGQFSWELSIDGTERLMFGDLLVNQTSGGTALRLEPRSPAWATRLPLTVAIALTDRGYSYTSHTEPSIH